MLRTVGNGNRIETALWRQVDANCPGAGPSWETTDGHREPEGGSAVKDVEKRKRVMARSMQLRHCIFNAKKACPCDVLRKKDVCPCPGEKLEAPADPPGSPSWLKVRCCHFQIPLECFIVRSRETPEEALEAG